MFFCDLSEIKFNIEPYVKIKSQLQNPLFQCERKHFIGNLDIFPLTSLSDFVSINKLTLIQKIFSQCDVRTHYDVTDKTNNISFDYLNIITSITARPIRLAVILVIMSVSHFKTTIILYIFKVGLKRV